MLPTLAVLYPSLWNGSSWLKRFCIFTAFVYRYLARISLKDQEKTQNLIPYDSIYNHCVCLDHVLYDLEIVDLGHPQVTSVRSKNRIIQLPGNWNGNFTGNEIEVVCEAVDQ